MTFYVSSGTIDEVDQQVNMTWVQPRVLDYSQVHVMSLHRFTSSICGCGL